MSVVQVKGEGEVGDCLLRMGREDPSLDQMGHAGKAFLCSAWSLTTTTTMHFAIEGTELCCDLKRVVRPSLHNV